MVKYLLDTNVLIECLRRNPKMVETVMAKGKGHDLAISAVTYGELLVGIHKNDTPRRRAALSKVLAPMQILAFDDHAAAEFAKIKSALERTGEGIGSYDMQIAGHAISAGRRLVTHNGDEFARVKQLKWEDWENG
ncbi:type II toxin-antitoxin system VapC family toxin [Puniceicoccus vermicola]|uniref:Ribonuclease VapC n=1 Tax=Puniceicoccus vermicola TaxID=388746 RepID=A0A7X1B1L5_9BACT|nr:type II toxin-antitoxin system VapC family toxin [Puniceicoccus vermicola]MBC2603953.1 type II toxin-antitoxin system VapC family toxin [Puniceicoccus vermicola]